MNIERLKSIILFVLVISSITLTANKWYSDNLWSLNHDLFSSDKNDATDTYNNESSADYSEKNFFLPTEIIINNNGKHVKYIKTSVNYTFLCNDIEDNLKTATDSDKISNSSYWEWTEKLSKKSCYFNYSSPYAIARFFENINEKQSELIGNAKEFIIAEESENAGSSIIYIKNSATNAVKKITVKKSGEHIKYQEKKAASSESGIYYAFELKSGDIKNYNKWLYANVEPNVTIDTESIKAEIPDEKNLFSNISSDELIYSDIIAKFGYNPSSIRKYVESDNSLVLVENYGTIKLHTSGLLEFKPLDISNGISINKKTVSETVSECFSFINDVTNCLGLNKKIYFENVTDLNNINSNTFTLEFDCMINGAKIIFPDDIYGMKHAVSVNVVDGKIVRYRQICKNFIFNSESIAMPDCVDSLNDFFVNKHNEKLLINDVFVGYIFDKNDIKWYPIWCGTDSDGNTHEITGCLR